MSEENVTEVGFEPRTSIVLMYLDDENGYDNYFSLTVYKVDDNVMVSAPFYNALYAINYRLPNVT